MSHLFRILPHPMGGNVASCRTPLRRVRQCDGLATAPKPHVVELKQMPLHGKAPSSPFLSADIGLLLIPSSYLSAPHTRPSRSQIRWRVCRVSFTRRKS